MRIVYHLLIHFCMLIPFWGSTQQLITSLGNPGTPREVPVICFHHIRKDVSRPNELTMSVELFQANMKALYDSGFHSISPLQLYEYYTNGKLLPAKPFMITFDDGNFDQWENCIEVMSKYNFKALFFIMTVTVGKKNYLDTNQIRLLSQAGHSIGCHTWDHQSVNSFKSKDYYWQIEKPKAYLESLTGSPVLSFAYPYGQWNEKIIPELKRSGFKLAFQLTEKSSAKFPLYTVRRLMVSGKWSTSTFMNALSYTFQLHPEFQLINPEL